MNRVIVLGNATVDLILDVERLPALGETLLASRLLRCAGGKGLNQAIAAARAGAKTTLIAPVGDDLDAAYLRSVVIAEAINLRPVWRVISEPTDISTIWVASSGENSIVSSAACARALTASEAPQLLADIGAGDLLLVQGNLTSETTLAAMRHGRAHGAQTVLNTAPIAWDMKEAVALADIVVANEPEASSLTDAGDETALRALRAAGPAAVVLTLGPRGALLADGDGVTAVSAPRVTAIDTAGAGDVMVGTLVAELVARRPLREAVALAVAAASLSVTRRGTAPSFPTSTEIDALRTATKARTQTD